MKKLIIILCLLYSTAQAQFLSEDSKTAKIPDPPKPKSDYGFLFHTITSGVTSTVFSFQIIDSTRHDVDTVYSISQNKPYRVITTVFKTYPDKDKMSFRIKYAWDEKHKYWNFYSVSISPVPDETASSYGSSSFYIGTPNLSPSPYWPVK